MYNKPLVTVVIPTFNRENTISYCIESVLAQTYREVDVIVVDDCSTDNTVSTVKRYPDSRVRCVVLKKRTGAQGARNRGIYEARSDWIAFQDSDDEWLPGKLEKQVAVLARANFNPWSFVCCNAYRFDKDRGEKSVRLLSVVEGEKQYETLLRTPGPLFPTILTSRRALEKIEYLDEQVPSFQEWDTSIRLARYCKITHLKEPLMIYHAGNADAISGSSAKHVEGFKYIVDKHEKDIKNYCGNDEWRKLNVQLLVKCLDLRMVDHYDRYRNAVGNWNKHRAHLEYLQFCRKLGIRPNNVFFRIFRKYIEGLGYYETGESGVIKGA